jgi:transcription antitermination factor NusG
MVKSGPFANNPFKVIAVDNALEKVTVAIPMMGNMGEFEFKLTEVEVIKKNKTY